MDIIKIRIKILEDIKPYVIKEGWNKDLFTTVSQSSHFKYEEIKALFPEGNKTLVQMYLNEIDKKMNNDSKKINLIRLRVHERIRELIILRLKIMLKDKKFVSKTFLYLLLPNNFKLATKFLYKISDQIWYLAGDHSTDFNFYSKRAILSSIYTITMMHFINNDNLNDTIQVLDKQLKRVSHIPKIKNRIRDLSMLVPQIIKLGNKFSFFKQ